MRPYTKRLTLALALLLTASTFSGCWDNKEINQVSIITGSAVDLSSMPGMIDLTLEIANTQNSQAGSGGSPSDGDSAFSMLKATSATVMGCLIQIDQNSNHTTMSKHNQVRLFGSTLCEQGLKDHIDMFIRDQQTRMEVPMLVVEGNAGEAISAKLAEEELCGIFLASMLEDQVHISPAYRVRLIDFMKTLLEGTTSAVIPLVKLFQEGEKQAINIIGMAVFKDDRMVGRLSNDDSLGYIWSLGKVKNSNVMLTEGTNTAVLHLSRLDCNRKVSLRPDGGVRVELHLTGISSIAELSGFGQTKLADLMPYLETLSKAEIRERILATFEISKELRADIYGFGTSVYRAYPRQWKEMEGNWDELFRQLELIVEVDLQLVSTGQIVQSLTMEENSQ
ncbi:MAG: Ger(x)C family spore germination protein [Candidatus Pelethousia sp.]|nr:Ger(x)C family spore germination protein [Candidatus Pelethousia sp.]